MRSETVNSCTKNRYSLRADISYLQILASMTRLVFLARPVLLFFVFGNLLLISISVEKFCVLNTQVPMFYFWKDSFLLAVKGLKESTC